MIADPESYASKTTDWQSLLFDNAVTQQHQLSVSVGTEKARYFISGFYTDQQGLLINTGQKRVAASGDSE